MEQSTKTLPLLIKNLKKWIAEQILHLQATQKGGTTAISANTISTGSCPMHPGSKHTEAECRGLKARNQGSSSNDKTYVHKSKYQGKAGKFTRYQGKGKEKSFDSSKVCFNQDKDKAGNRFQGSSPFKKSYNTPSKASGPQHPGGSLEDLLTDGYKRRKFDPAKSRKYQALQAYFTRQGISNTAGAAASTSGNGANAAGQAAASNTAFGPSGFDLRYPYAFQVSIGKPDVDMIEALQVVQMDERIKLLIEPQDERIMSSVLDTSLAVENIDRYIEDYIDPQTRVDQQTYALDRAKFLEEVKGSYLGFANDDFPVPIDILESDLARIDFIFLTFSSGDIEEWVYSTPKKRLQIKDVFGSDATDASMEFESDDEIDHNLKIVEYDDESDAAHNLERDIDVARAASENKEASDLEGAMIDAVTPASEEEEDYEADQV
jgi:hypothetical protein